MKTGTRLLFGAVVATCTLVGIALATPRVGILFTNLAVGATDAELLPRARVQLPAVPGQEDEWSAKLLTTGPSNFIVQDVTILPGGHTGWHSHPGILLSSVMEGSIEWYNSKCEKQVYNAGDSLTETTETHFVNNPAAVNARFMVTYIIAKGQASRIDQPAPACAAALGLN